MQNAAVTQTLETLSDALSRSHAHRDMAASARHIGQMEALIFGTPDLADRVTWAEILRARLAERAALLAA
jgi:hypothetical protein